MGDLQTEAMRRLVRIRSAEATLETLFYKAALDTINEVLDDLGEAKLDQAELLAAAWRPDQFAKMLQLWKTKSGQKLSPAILSLFRTSAAQTLQANPVLAKKLGALKPDYLDSIRNVRADAVLASLQPNIVGFGQTAFDKVTAVLQGSLEQGLALPKTQEAVRQALGVEARRARAIARTMAGTAVNGADHAVYEEMVDAGLELRRKWLATSDGRTRDTHRAVNGKNQNEQGGWSVGGAFMKYPGDPAGPAKEVVNCRCTVVLEPAEDEDLPLTPSPALDGPGSLEGESEVLIEPKAQVATMDAADALVPHAADTASRPHVSPAMEAIAKVHRVPEGMPKLLSISMEDNATYNGVYYSLPGTNTGGLIKLTTGGPNPAATYLHEFGHFFDRNGLGGDVSSWASHGTTGTMRKLIDAMRETPSMKSVAGRGDDWSRYALQDHELFARGYAQWIGKETGNTEWNDYHDAKYGHWSRREFEPLADLYRQLFREAGLLT